MSGTVVLSSVWSWMRLWLLASMAIMPRSPVRLHLMSLTQGLPLGVIQPFSICATPPRENSSVLRNTSSVGTFSASSTPRLETA